MNSLNLSISIVILIIIGAFLGPIIFVLDDFPINVDNPNNGYQNSDDQTNSEPKNTVRARNNAPVVTFLGPNSGEVNGIIKINASVLDLENNLDDEGVVFYYSTNKSIWIPIGNDPSGNISGIDTVYEILWDTTTVVDNVYWLRAYAKDKTDLDGFDISTDFIIVHNNRNNPPIITFLEPKGGLPLERRTLLKVEVIDFENDVERVSFYYSMDNKTWLVIGTNVNQIENTYTTIWSLEDFELTNGLYYLKAKAEDERGESTELITGPLEYYLGKDVDDRMGNGSGTANGTKKDKDEEKGFLPGFEFLYLLGTIIIIVLIIKKQQKN